MTVLRCTAKLLKAMKAVPKAAPRPAQNRLGAWTANLIRVSRVQLVLAVNDRTRFGVVMDAAPYATLPERFGHALLHALLYIGIPSDAAAAEAELMYPLELAATNDRSVLGTLNQFAWNVDCDVRYGVAHSARQLTQRLAQRPVLKPKHILFPVDRVREAFGLPPLDGKARLGAL